MLENLSLAHPISELLIATLLGAFLGVRREMKAHESSKNRSFMGIRTMTMLCAMGALSTFFGSPWIPVVFFIGLLMLLGIAYSHGSFAMNRIGITTELSAIITFWIGVLVGVGEPVLAIIITVFLASLNVFKERLHGFVYTLNEKEWIGALQLLALSGVVLPFLPREPIDPWHVFVPFNVWLLVMLISGIGFVGYFLIKYFGAKGGIPLTGFLGALISSTAVTTSMAVQSKSMKLNDIFAVGILIGVATMEIRVLFEIVFLGTAEMVKQLALIPISMAVASVMAAFYFYRRTLKKRRFFWETKPEIKLESPFELKPALQFGFIFLLVLFARVIGQKYFGDSGVYAAAALSGIIDVDAIVLSTLESLKLGVADFDVSRNAIAIALFTNTFLKIVYVGVLGSRELLKRIAVSISFVTLVGIVTMFLV